MTASRDPDRLIRTFLLEGEEQLDDRVYDGVRAAIEQKSQRVVIGPWRFPEMNKILTYGLAAAAVVVAVFVGAQVIGLPSGGGLGTAPTASPSAASSPADIRRAQGDLDPGTFTLNPPNPDGPSVTVTFDLAADGWTGDGWTIGKGAEPSWAALGVWVGHIDVYGDPCAWEGTTDGREESADDVARALAAQPLRDATDPTDITLGGYPGTLIELSVPSDADFETCDNGEFRSWGPEENSRYSQGPGQIDRLWILDVENLVVIVDATWFPETDPALVAELEAIVASIMIDAE